MTPAGAADSDRASGPPGGPDPLAEPVVPVRRGWTGALSLANWAIWVGWYGPSQILPASRAAGFAPGDGMPKETLVAWVAGAGAVLLGRIRGGRQREPGVEYCGMVSLWRPRKSPSRCRRNSWSRRAV